jgi:aminopeptidase N
MSLRGRRLNRKREFASAQAESHYLPSLQAEPVHQTIKLKLDLTGKTAAGSVSTIFRAKKDGIRKVELDAFDLEITDVTDISGNEINWDYNGRKLKIFWSQPFKQGEKREITVFYYVVEPVGGMYFYVPDQEYPRRPELVFIDNETQKARYWLPCIDHPSVRCTLDFYLTAGRDYTFLANGKLISEKENDDGTKTVYWRSDIPCPVYLTSFVAGDFISWTDTPADLGYGEIEVAYFASKYYNPDDLKRTFDRTPKMLSWLYNKFKTAIAYPKYYQYVTPHSFGAMENISLVSWDDTFILDEIHYREFAAEVDQINVHEMAHTWFGNLVGARDFAHSWLKEAWATYLELVWFEDMYGPDEFSYKLFEAAAIYFSEADSAYRRPIVTNRYDKSWSLFDAHLYQGAALRLHMLRKIIGDEIFWEAATDYLQTFRNQTVETIDFQRIMEKHAGASLQKFFDQWLYSPGYPQLKTSFDYDAEKKLCSLKIEQDQVDPEKSVPAFDFFLDVQLETEKGIFENRVFEISEKEHTFYFPSAQKPLQVRLDPEFKLLFSLEFNPGKDLLKYQLISGNVMGRILAARELAKEGGLGNLRAIAAAYESETFWGARVQFAAALSEAESFAGTEELLGLLKIESSPLVLHHLILSLQNKRDEKVASAMKDFLNSGSLLYDARGAALNVLGSQRKEEYLEFLKGYDPGTDRKNLVRAAKYSAIGQVHCDAALNYLLERVRYGSEPDNVRPAIISAISEAASHTGKILKDGAAEVLSDILRKEKNELIIRTTAANLAKLKNPASVPVLEMARTKIEHGEHPLINRLIQSVEKGQNTDEEVKKLREEIETLKESSKKMQGRIDNLDR